jgi:60 kDa SS-A/Ro ribonucleoprotein
MKNYANIFSSKQTSQKEKIPDKDQVKNNAGGYVFKIDDLQRAKRFLILGSDSNTFYQSSKKLTIENANVILNLIKSGKGKEVLDLAVDISENGKARKNEPAIFALVLCFTYGNNELKNYAVEKFNKIIRIGTHLFQFIHTFKQLRGFGKISKKIFSKWYIEKALNDLAYQVVKYQGRTVEEGKSNSKWTHRDILRLMKFKTDIIQRDNLFHYIVKNKLKVEISDDLKIIEGFEKAKICNNENEMIKLIRNYRLSREMIPTEFLNKKIIQEQLFETSGLISIVRSLATWTSSGLINDYNIDFVNKVCDKITNKEIIKKSKIHPLQILDAIKTYGSGKSFRGSSTWNPVQKILIALNEAFYLSFDNVEATNKKIMLALDVSGSMSWESISGSLLTPREVSACLAMITARIEKNYIIKGFSHELVELNINPTMDLNTIIQNIENIDMGGTDCALPMIDAMKNNCYDIDAFIIYTDNETWFGNIHPCQALNQYNNKANNKAKLITVGMTATGFSIADPDNKNMFDIVGCSTDTPQIISDIIIGAI